MTITDHQNEMKTNFGQKEFGIYKTKSMTDKIGIQSIYVLIIFHLHGHKV